MKIIQITPGAGGMYCGCCFRDNALVAALRKLGHDTLMIPLYLPLTLDEPDQSAGTPTFFGGINVYLEQKSAFFRNAPNWLHRLLDAPVLLNFASKLGAKTRAQDVGELILSMVRGEEGHQARELNELIVWLKSHDRPDVICLSNALLLGLARQLRRELNTPVVCLLSGEDAFLDALPAPHREAVWQTLSERAQEIDLFIAPSRYFGELMQRRLGFTAHRLRVVLNGINLEGYEAMRNAERGTSTLRSSAKEDGRNERSSVLGYFARLCPEKGLELLAEAYVLIRQRGRCPDLKLHIGGGLGPSDQAFVNRIRGRFAELGFDRDVTFYLNVDRAQKLEFFRGLSVFSTPALYGEAFGLYVIEAMAAGVPVVQPRHAAFPEIIAETGGGVICEPTALALAEAIEELVLNPDRACALGQTGRESVVQQFSSRCMAENIVGAFREVTDAHRHALRQPQSAIR